MKTRLADLVSCPDALWDTQHGRRLSQKHIDFVLYDAWTARIVAAIELDDRSHLRPDRRRRDRFVRDVFRSAGIPLVRFRCASRYDVHALQEQLQASSVSI